MLSLFTIFVFSTVIRVDKMAPKKQLKGIAAIRHVTTCCRKTKTVAIAKPTVGHGVAIEHQDTADVESEPRQTREELKDRRAVIAFERRMHFFEKERRY